MHSHFSREYPRKDFFFIYLRVENKLEYITKYYKSILKITKNITVYKKQDSSVQLNEKQELTLMKISYIITVIKQNIASTLL